MNRRRSQMRAQGFTLLEVLLVIAILGILAGAVAFTLGGTQKNQEINLTKILVDETVPAALDRYKLENKEYPNTIDELVPNYLKKSQTVDAWQEPLQYTRNGETYQLYSKGPGRNNSQPIYRTE